MPGVARLLGRGDPDPRVLRGQRLVDKKIRRGAGADGDGAVGAIADGAPGQVGRGGGLEAVGGDEGLARRGVESQWGVGEAVVDWEGVGGAVAGQGAAAVLVGHHPLAVGDLRDRCHAGAVGIGWVGDVVDGVVPREEVGGGLVDKFLAVCRVALVGVENH